MGSQVGNRDRMIFNSEDGKKVLKSCSMPYFIKLFYGKILRFVQKGGAFDPNKKFHPSLIFVIKSLSLSEGENFVVWVDSTITSK